jgi:hypothetical protein
MLRRITAAGTVAAALAAITGVASANPITVSAKVNTGTVSITQTPDPVTGGVVYAVSIQGLIRDHGWTYDGELSGVRHTTESFTENLSSIGTFDVTADPAGVTGMCDTWSTIGNTVTTDAPVDTTIYCVLSKDGSTPWLTVIDSYLAPDVTDTTRTTWRGYYALTDTSTPTFEKPPPTHGDSQVIDETVGGGDRYKLQLSGQVAVGSGLYTGEISSDWSGVSYIHDGEPEPTVKVSGTDNGHTVTGPCSGAWTSSGWNFDCSLSLDSGPAADVRLSIVTGNSMSFCGDTADGSTQCDSYATGEYTG